MARGTPRAPSQNAYRGSVGKTQTTTLHVTGSRGDLIAAQVVTTIDAVSDPELVDRLHSEDPGRALNTVRAEGGETIRVPVPIVYHDPAAELLVLVLGDAHRHREIDERIHLLQRLRDDNTPIPAYAKDFTVVYGPAGLRAYLESRANDALASSRTQDAAKDVERRTQELAAREAELDRRARELDRRANELDAAAASSQHARASGEREDDSTRPVPLSELTDMDAGHAQATPTIDFDEDETTSASIVPPGSDPLTTATSDLPMDVVTDPWLDKACARDVSSITADKDGKVRLALVAGEQLARGLGGNLDVRVLLLRTQHYPVITLVIGPPAALRVPSTTQLALVPLDVALDAHRTVLAALGRAFELTIELLVRGRRIRRAKITAPLAENVGYILRAAEDHLRELTASGGAGAASFEKGRDLVVGAGYDLLGVEHPDASEFRDDKLAQLQTAQHLRRAIAMARRFAKPAREDYLVCTRGFPLPRWRELRRHVLESAVAWGLWMGPELAQVAVSEGLARSRRDLVLRLDRGFDMLKRDPAAFDIDADAADDNYQALAAEAKALGVELPRSGRPNGTIASDAVSQVSGSIGETPANGIERAKSTAELVAELEDRSKRVAAALQLCDRADPRAAAPVIAAVTKMSRAEAVRVLGMSVKFGDAAAAPLTHGLQSSKGFLRHGCALALALLRTDEGTQAVIDLLLSEPTEIWREVARAVGQLGPSGLMPLASAYGRLGDGATPQTVERVAWAMAHIAVRGGKPAVEAMANGSSVVAPVARQALAFHASAAQDHVRVRPGAEGSQGGRDITVNRAFSRRFFEALEQGLPDAGKAGLDALDASRPFELLEQLDEQDLLDAEDDDDDEAELDESDLIQT